ncbi:MAG: threonine--tRNA ligase [Calditrichales bacterium]|nr:threonine--tRNA ligase [Calditrichales bacterium]
MSKINIKFPDNSEKQFNTNITPLEIAKSISNSLAKKAVAAKFNGVIISLAESLTDSGDLQILTFKDDEGREVFWHSSAHLMAQAIKRLYPEAQLGIGPPIDDGFYYDIDLDYKISPEDFEKIENEMAKIVDENFPAVRKVLSTNEALNFFKKENELLKIELIEELKEQITVYSQGEFTDLCRGPHAPSTGYLGKYFKLLSVAGAYWRGDEKNKMLQRIYAVNYPDKKMLKQHIKRVEEAKKRDHRKLGRELDLFSIQDEVGSGLILWHPKGALIRDIIENYWKQEHVKSGYGLVNSPHIAKLDLWKKSGHTDFYQENMFSPMEVDEVEYQIKPMNCPFHMMIYSSKIRSYRDLPIRYAELGTVYRYERSGVLHGLMRVRGFTQDDAHIFCHPDQLTDEIIGVIELNKRLLEKFGFTEYDVFLSTRPEKFVGSEESWEHATEALRQALELKKVDYKIDPGEGVFYGPKIDIKIKDVLGRSWQCTTIQVDFNLPERFDLSFVDADGMRHRPITIHRALLGSLERFFGILIEHYAGNFPLWLTPVQVKVLPIADRHKEFAGKVEQQLSAKGFRVESDGRNEKMGYKIREAEVNKIPYMIIIGDKELENNKISVRHKGEGDLGQMEISDFIDNLIKDISPNNTGIK